MNQAATPPSSGPRVEEPIETPTQKNAPTGWAPPQHTRRTTLIIAALAVVAIVIVLYAWGLPPFTRSIQITDNAYVRGKTTLISPQVSGYLVSVPVQDYQHVHEGDVLAQIDDRIYRQKSGAGPRESELADRSAGELRAIASFETGEHRRAGSRTRECAGATASRPGGHEACR